MFKATEKWSKLLCINCNMIDWNSLWNNSRFIDKILWKINQLSKYSYYKIHTMLLLGPCYYWKVVVYHIHIFNCLSFYFSMVSKLFFQLLLISMSRRNIPISLTLCEDRDPLTGAFYKFMLTHAQDSYFLSIWRLLLTLLFYVNFLK